LIDVNNLRHTEDHLNVGKVYQNVSISKYGQNKMNPGALGRQGHAHTWQNNCFPNKFTT